MKQNLTDAPVGQPTGAAKQGYREPAAAPITVTSPFGNFVGRIMGTSCLYFMYAFPCSRIRSRSSSWMAKKMNALASYSLAFCHPVAQ